MKKIIIPTIVVYLAVGLIYAYKSRPLYPDANKRSADYLEIALKSLTWPYSIVVDYINFKKIDTVYHN